MYYFQDWSAHKKACKKPAAAAGPGAPAMSPFGEVFNIFSGASTPMSATADFFAPMFGYTAADPTLVYKDLVNAYRLLRLGAHANAYRVLPVLQNIEFSDWMDRVTRAELLPKWWDKEVNNAGIEAYAREDDWGRLDRDVTKEEIRAHVGKRLISLEMMVERIVNSS